MHPLLRDSTALLLTAILSLTSLTTGCKSSQEASPAGPQNQPAQTQPAQTQPAQTQPAQTLATPLSLDDLVAPIALYPDQLLAQILTASTTPQEVLDGGNLIIENQNLKGDALTSAAKTAGFGLSMQYLMNFPQVVDNMCQEMEWTTQLGQAFQSDQKGVMAAVQRRRSEAQQAGNLASSRQMTVETKTDNGQKYVEIKPADPKVVYVPQYNPVTIYNVQSAPAPTPAPTTTTTTSTQSTGVSTQTAAGIGLLSFGVGMVVGAAIHHNNNYYPYPSWGHGGIYHGGHPYYPPHYHPAYPSYHPANGYHPPPNYHWNQVNHNVNVNVNKNYYNQFNSQTRVNTLPSNSPTIGNTSVNSVNGNRAGQGNNSYQGARPANANQKPGASMANAVPRNQQLAATRNQPANTNRSNTSNRTPSAANTANARSNAGNSGSMNRGGASPTAQPTNRGGDRGYANASRPSTGMANTPAARPTSSLQTQNLGGGTGAFGGGSAKADRAASTRGRSSMGAGGGLRRR
jgi:Protein of unknown function (DUF3300)